MKVLGIKIIPELSSNTDEHISCLNLDRNKILASNPSSTSSSISIINDHDLVDEISSSISAHMKMGNL